MIPGSAAFGRAVLKQLEGQQNRPPARGWTPAVKDDPNWRKLMRWAMKMLRER